MFTNLSPASKNKIRHLMKHWSSPATINHMNLFFCCHMQPFFILDKLPVGTIPLTFIIDTELPNDMGETLHWHVVRKGLVVGIGEARCMIKSTHKEIVLKGKADTVRLLLLFCLVPNQLHSLLEQAVVAQASSVLTLSRIDKP